jgi:hypothetical protein
MSVCIYNEIDGIGGRGKMHERGKATEELRRMLASRHGLGDVAGENQFRTFSWEISISKAVDMRGWDSATS